MLPRLSLCHPQFIPSVAGHSELDSRSPSRAGYCSPAEQKRKGSGGETQQSRAPNQGAPPSIHLTRRTEPAASPEQQQHAWVWRGEAARPPPSPCSPLLRALPSRHPRPMPGLLRLSWVPSFTPVKRGEPGTLRCFALLPFESWKELFQCLMDSSLANLWCLSCG